MTGHYRKGQVENIKPGYRRTAWIAKRSEFTILATPDDAATGAAKNIIEDDHTFGAGKGFMEVILVADKNSIAAEKKGEAGAAWLNWKYNLVIPGDGPLAQAIIEDLMNEELIILFRDKNCPVDGYVQLGCDCSAGEATEVSFDSGTEGGDAGKAWSMAVEATCRNFYKGTLTLQT